MTRTWNCKKLRKAVLKVGLEQAAVNAEISASTLHKMILGLYPSWPKQDLRERLCESLDLEESEIFTPVNSRVANA